ncbi:hypothetical protein DVH05_028616 [Phytophthora capsici]|nr:hypothetical protein DVH05_028511 [Phytophthora capsici]KAG1709831.1 hypothetical protein DVH05_028616 [Phytophthora capsici]
MSISPSVSRQISGPVVSKWICGLAGFSNCPRIKALVGSLATSSLATAKAPVIPLAPGVSTTSQPKDLSRIRRSMDIVSGITSVNLYPRTADAKARPIPVLPDVGSMMCESFCRRPDFSASRIMLRPIRSLTEAQGSMNSHLTAILAWQPSVTRFRYTSGVLPMRAVMSLAMLGAMLT